MEKSLQDFYEEFIENSDYKSIYNFNLNNLFTKVFPLTFTGKNITTDENITFQVTKIERYKGREYRNNRACIVYFKPENENITIQATFYGDDLEYPYFITLNGNKYEIE